MTHAALPASDHTPAWRRAALACAALAGLYCLLLAALLTATMLQDKRENPLNAPAFTQTKRLLVDNPRDTALQAQAAQQDLALRQSYFARHAALTRGGWLLLAGGAVTIIAIKAWRTLSKAPPGPDLRVAPFDQSAARYAVVAASVALAALMATGAFASRHTPALPRPEPPVAQAPYVIPSFQDMSNHWPTFRGPGGLAIAPDGNHPAAWDGTTGLNIAWKTPIPLPGHNSPVIWADRVFLSGATEDKRQVYCFDLSTGTLLWTGDVPSNAREPVEPMSDTGFAASTLATDGTSVFAIFATGDIAAFDFSGRKRWHRYLGFPESAYGYAASLAYYNGNVIVQWDIGHEEGEDSHSRLLALNAATGKTAWETKRPTSNAWASPIIVNTPSGHQLITAASPFVIAYDPATGAERWRAKLLTGDVAPLPYYHDGTVYVAQDMAVVAAIATDGTGDVTKTHVRWKQDERGMPDIVSPIVADNRLFTLTSDGTLWCFDAATGNLQWSETFKTPFHASPVLLRGKLALIDTRGTWHLIEPGPAYKSLATNTLGEPVSASPAFTTDRILIRSRKHLFCIGTGKAGGATP